ncbi:unnamed protein product, partial [Iphiclides podalirius]
MPTPLQAGGPASGPPPERKRRRKRDDPQSSAALEPDDDGDMSPEEEPRNAPAAPAAPAPAPSSAPAPTSPPAAPDAVDLTSRRDSPPLSSDVERFDGKIVYNPDGSAYIIEDPEMSEGETSLSDLPKIEPGCIVDSRDSNIVEKQLDFPQIASAFYVSRNSSAVRRAVRQTGGGTSAGQARRAGYAQLSRVQFSWRQRHSQATLAAR